MSICPLMHEYDRDSGWDAIPIDFNGKHLYTHIVPCADLKRHQLDPTCWCAPRVDEDDRTVVIHNSADGREAHEQGRKLQ